MANYDCDIFLIEPCEKRDAIDLIFVEEEGGVASKIKAMLRTGEDRMRS